MALTITPTIKFRTVIGGAGRISVVDLAISGTYTTSGDTMPTAKALGMEAGGIDMILTDNVTNATPVAFIPKFDLTAGKVLFYGLAASAGLTQIANGTTIAGTMRVVVVGDIPYQ